MGIIQAVLERFRAAKHWRETHCFAGASIQTWLDRSYRMYNEQHHPEVVADAMRKLNVNLNGCGYYPYTRLKIDAARIYVDGTYQHAIDAPFTLEPTKNPALNEDQKGEVALLVLRLMGAQLKAVAGDWEDVWNSSAKNVKTEAAKKWLKNQAQKMAITHNAASVSLAQEACDFRKDMITDQFEIGGWVSAWGLMTHHLMADPYTVIAAREYRSIPVMEWKGKRPARTMKTVPTFRPIDPRNVFVGADSTNAQDGIGVTELTIRTRSDLISLLQTDDESIDKQAVREALMSIKVDGAENDWLGISSQLNTLESHSLIHQGLFSGKELAKAGITKYEDDEYYNCTAEICHNKLIRFEVLDYNANARNYYSAQHSRTNTTYAGECISSKLYTVQNQLNLAMALRDRNFAMASGPMMTLNAGYFDRPQDVSIMPYARNFANPDRAGQASRGVEQYQIDPQYITMDNHIENLKRQGDEISGVVSGLQGMARSGLSRTTLGGAVLDQTAGERMMTAAILNLDRTIIEPMVEHLDADNMLSSDTPTEYKRGDIRIIGKGISGLREIEMRGRLVAEGLPVAMQLAQSGVVPAEALQDASKQYLQGKGFDTSSMPTRAARRELNNTLPRQTNDGRTYNPEPSTAGVSE